MNKKIISSIYLVVFCSFIFVGQVFGLTMELQVSSMDIKVGDSFSIDVFANDVWDGIIIDPDFPDEVLAFGFDITNSNTLVADLDVFLPWEVQAPFDDDSEFYPNTDVAGSVLTGITDNEIFLATLNFVALGQGNVELGIFSDIFDLNEGLVYFLEGNKDITTSINLTVNPVPEPATILLLTTGMLGMGVLGRKKLRKKSKQ